MHLHIYVLFYSKKFEEKTKQNKIQIKKKKQKKKNLKKKQKTNQKQTKKNLEKINYSHYHSSLTTYYFQLGIIHHLSFSM